MATRAQSEGGSGRKKKRHDLPDQIEISIGMEVMVTQNVETGLDVTNGARGEIVYMVLHPDEPAIGDEPLVRLKYLPNYILVKLNRTRATQLDVHEASVIPVEVSTKMFRINIQGPDGKNTSRTVRRRQFLMTAAYGFTDYRSQSQTIPYVLVDIGSPPTGTLSLFNLYVALSRSSGRTAIRLLRDFDDKLFQASHDTELMIEDERLEKLDGITKAWYEKMGRSRKIFIDDNSSQL